MAENVDDLDRPHRLRDSLLSLPGLYEECGESLSRPLIQLVERISGGWRGGIELNERGLSARSEILAFLVAWSDLTVDELEIDDRPLRTVPGLAAFLGRHLEWLAAHPAAGDFKCELDHVAGLARHALGDGQHLREIGTCVHEGCDNTLHVRGVTDGDQGSGLEVRCEGGHAWRRDAWLDLAHRLRWRNRTAALNGM